MTEQHIDPATPLDRLDMMLVASGLVESRAKAPRLIKAGHVRVDGETITKPEFSLHIDAEKCIGCKKCIRELGCPAIVLDNGNVCIDDTMCTGCELCSQVCPAAAIIGGKKHE